MSELWKAHRALNTAFYQAPNTALHSSVGAAAEMVTDNEISWVIYGATEDGAADSAFHAALSAALSMRRQIRRLVFE